MNLTQVEYFLAAAEKLNFTAAAKSLYVSQPALSKQISMLEEELGVSLMLRTNKSVQLTEAGRQFQEDLEKILVEIDEAKERAIQIGKGYEKVLRVGCFDAAVLDDFLPLFLETVKNYPVHYEVELVRCNFKELRKAMEEDSVDLVFTLGFERAEYYGCNVYDLASRRGAFIYSINSPLAKKDHLEMADFEKETFYLMSEKISPGGYQSSIHMLESLMTTLPKLEKVRDMFSLLTYVEMGKGYALLDAAVMEKRNDLLKFDIESEENELEVIAVCKKGRKEIADLLSYAEKKYQ